MGKNDRPSILENGYNGNVTITKEKDGSERDSLNNWVQESDSTKLMDKFKEYNAKNIYFLSIESIDKDNVLVKSVSILKKFKNPPQFYSKPYDGSGSFTKISKLFKSIYIDPLSVQPGLYKIIEKGTVEDNPQGETSKGEKEKEKEKSSESSKGKTSTSTSGSITSEGSHKSETKTEKQSKTKTSGETKSSLGKTTSGFKSTQATTGKATGTVKSNPQEQKQKGQPAPNPDPKKAPENNWGDFINSIKIIMGKILDGDGFSKSTKGFSKAVSPIESLASSLTDDSESYLKRVVEGIAALGALIWGFVKKSLDFFFKILGRATTIINIVSDIVKAFTSKLSFSKFVKTFEGFRDTIALGTAVMSLVSGLAATAIENASEVMDFLDLLNGFGILKKLNLKKLNDEIKPSNKQKSKGKPTAYNDPQQTTEKNTIPQPNTNNDINAQAVAETILKAINDKLRDSVVAYG
jgi:hypothetical protein